MYKVQIKKPDLFILYPYKLEGDRTVFLSENELAIRFPLAWQYLQFAKQDLASRGSARMNYPTWYALWNCRDMRLLTGPKIVVPTIADKPSFALDKIGEYFFLGSGAGGPGAYGLVTQDSIINSKYILGLLNSRVTDIFIKATSSVFRGGYRAYSQQFLWNIPYRNIDFDNPADKARHDQMVALVERMLALHQQLAEARTPQAGTMLQRQIEATDRQIDRLVYELYGLTDEEIAIVEGEG